MDVKYTQIIHGINIKPYKGAFGFASVTLISDGKENILFDTGSYGVRKEIIELKRSIHINKVFISHLHFDHCSNLDLFTDVPIYVNELEYKNLYNNYSDIDIYKPICLLVPIQSFVFFNSEENISDNIRIKLTPGHTIGHSSLAFICGGKNVIVAGDAIKSLIDLLNINGYGNAQFPERCLITKKAIRDSYDVIIPGHSEIIDMENLHYPLFELQPF